MKDDARRKSGDKKNVTLFLIPAALMRQGLLLHVTVTVTVSSKPRLTAGSKDRKGRIEPPRCLTAGLLHFDLPFGPSPPLSSIC
jgi:hypothetical protein